MADLKLPVPQTIAGGVAPGPFPAPAPTGRFIAPKDPSRLIPRRRPPLTAASIKRWVDEALDDWHKATDGAIEDIDRDIKDAIKDAEDSFDWKKYYLSTGINLFGLIATFSKLHPLLPVLGAAAPVVKDALTELPGAKFVPTNRRDFITKVIELRDLLIDKLESLHRTDDFAESMLVQMAEEGWGEIEGQAAEGYTKKLENRLHRRVLLQLFEPEYIVPRGDELGISRRAVRSNMHLELMLSLVESVTYTYRMYHVFDPSDGKPRPVSEWEVQLAGVSTKPVPGAKALDDQLNNEINALSVGRGRIKIVEVNRLKCLVNVKVQVVNVAAILCQNIRLSGGSTLIGSGKITTAWTGAVAHPARFCYQIGMDMQPGGVTLRYMRTFLWLELLDMLWPNREPPIVAGFQSAKTWRDIAEESSVGIQDDTDFTWPYSF